MGPLAGVGAVLEHALRELCVPLKGRVGTSKPRSPSRGTHDPQAARPHAQSHERWAPCACEPTCLSEWPVPMLLLQQRMARSEERGRAAAGRGRPLPRQLRSRGRVPGAESTEALAARLFRADNRMGVAGTLHRISAIRDRTHAVIGLTYRVGRAMPGALRRPCAALPAAAPRVTLPPRAPAYARRIPSRPASGTLRNVGTLPRIPG